MSLLSWPFSSWPSTSWPSGAVADLAGLVWPVRCAGCGRPGQRVCPPCRGTLHAGIRRAPAVSGQGGPGGPEIWAAAGYAGVPGRLVVAWKDRGRHDLTGTFVAALAPVLAACRETLAGPGDPPWLVVPVPASARARRHRGADLVHDLAVAAVRRQERGFVVRRALRLVRRVADQAGLDADGRRRNLAGAFGLRHGSAGALAGRRVLLVDDVVTTGATVTEATRVLTSEGAQVVGGCCLCVTDRRLGVSKGGDLV